MDVGLGARSSRATTCSSTSRRWLADGGLRPGDTLALLAADQLTDDGPGAPAPPRRTAAELTARAFGRFGRAADGARRAGAALLRLRPRAGTLRRSADPSRARPRPSACARRGRPAGRRASAAAAARRAGPEGPGPGRRRCSRSRRAAASRSMVADRQQEQAGLDRRPRPRRCRSSHYGEALPLRPGRAQPTSRLLRARRPQLPAAGAGRRTCCVDGVAAPRRQRRPPACRRERRLRRRRRRASSGSTASSTPRSCRTSPDRRARPREPRGRRGRGRSRSSTSSAPSAAPPRAPGGRPRRRRREGIVFMPTNGVGLGHAQRCALIAGALAPRPPAPGLRRLSELHARW